MKGLNKYTYNIIWDEIEKGNYEYITAEDLAEKLGIARILYICIKQFVMFILLLVYGNI
ncbi:MAG TPA: hypothetical protein VHQ24_18100 [Lachnospiraceae bacterium]|nr:hypothetical protein [Lachnospiraceae bacterium]HEX3078772.1 hypothetical protein [Lachnospiraceae bacterium]